MTTQPDAAFSLQHLKRQIQAIPWTDLAVPLAVMAAVGAMIIPLPSFLLDLLISINITLSAVVLLVALYLNKPSDFSVFPSTLLLLTLFRLALNVSSSRRILLGGNEGTVAAGAVIEAFGRFVVGGSYVVGTVIFLVLVAIQYVVINHGAVRISEVTARFTLDALPGKQLSIDSDLNSGLIDETEARRRRAALSAETEFYGAMDGATRFTQRDAVASLLITAINIVAGLAIGVLQLGLAPEQAVQTYTVLTIGDGLVTVVPALLISVAGGLIVTRSNSENRLGADFQKQVFTRREPFLIVAAILFFLALIPAMPKLPFLLTAAAAGTLVWKIPKREVAPEAAPPPIVAKTADAPIHRVDPLSIQVGLGLVRMLDGGQDSPLLRRLSAIRQQLAQDLGLELPPIRVTDDLQLKSREYVIRLRGNAIGRFELEQGQSLALATGRSTGSISGIQTVEPAFQMPATWIPAATSDEARKAGYTVVDSLTILTTHLSELMKRFGFELFTRHSVKQLLDRVAEENPKAVEDLVPKQLSLVLVQKVLQNLLRERVSIRDASSIIEALGEASLATKNPVLLTDFVRQSIRRTVVRPYLSPDQTLNAHILDAPLESAIESAVEHGELNSHLALPPGRIREISERISRIAKTHPTGSVLLTSSTVRFFVRQLVEPNAPNLAVIAHGELPFGVKVLSLGPVA